MRKQLFSGITLSFILILVYTSAYTQKYKGNVLDASNIHAGKPYPEVEAGHKDYFQRDGQILAVKIDNKAIILQKFNKDLSFQKVRVYEDMPRYIQVEKITVFNDRYFLFYSQWDGEKQTEQLFYREIDFTQGIFLGQGKSILKIEGKITGSPIVKTAFGSFGVFDKFDFQFSSDSSKMLIQYRVKPKIRRDAKNHDVIGMSVFDENINLLWSKEVEMPYTEKKMDILDYSIDSKGNSYILATVFDDNTTDIKKSRKGKPNYHIELLRVKANSTDIKITPIRLDDKFINGIALFESPGDYMIGAGFYNKGKNLADANGIMLFKVGDEGSLYDIATYEIPLEVLNLHASSRDKRKNSRKQAKGKAEFEDLVLRHLIVGTDGSIVLAGEQYYMKEQRQISGSAGAVTTRSYHYNDILIAKIDASGQLTWMKKLPKVQMGGYGRGGMSYEYMQGAEDSHLLLFLDNVKNIDLPLDKVPERHIDGKGGFLTAYQINDDDGAVKKVSLLDTRDVQGMKIKRFMVTRIVPLTPGEFVYEAYKKRKEDILIKVKVEARNQGS